MITRVIVGFAEFVGVMIGLAIMVPCFLVIVSLAAERWVARVPIIGDWLLASRLRDLIFETLGLNPESYWAEMIAYAGLLWGAIGMIFLVYGIGKLYLGLKRGTRPRPPGYPRY